MEQILSRFHTNKVPTLGLTPTITILDNDGELIITGTMYEIGGGCYGYDFLNYDKTITYLITSDGGLDTLDDRYQHTTNSLDAYDNKKDWGKGGLGGGSTFIDYGKIVKDVRNPNIKDLEKGGLGDKLYKLDTAKVIKAVQENKTEIDLQPVLDYIQKGDNKIIKEIKNIPDYTEQLQAIEEVLAGKIEGVGEKIIVQGQATFEGIKQEIENIEKIDYDKIEGLQKEIDFGPLLDYMGEVKELVEKGNEKVDGLNIENIDYGIIEDFIIQNKKEFQDIAIQLSDKIQANKELIQDNINTEAIDGLVNISEQIKELKEIENKTNELHKKYLLGIYNIVYGTHNK